MPSAIRPAFAALWNLDLAFADVVATSSDPRLAAIRLAWWRERLEELDRGTVPTEPRLQAVRLHLLPRQGTGAELSKLEDAWLPMLEPFPWTDEQVKGFVMRGRLLFGVGARLLGAASEEAERAGETWSLHDGAVHCSDPASRALLDQAARLTADRLPSKAARAVRPLTVIAAIAAADLVGSQRGAAALKHRLTGRFPS